MDDGTSQVLLALRRAVKKSIKHPDFPHLYTFDLNQHEVAKSTKHQNIILKFLEECVPSNEKEVEKKLKEWSEKIGWNFYFLSDIGEVAGRYVAVFDTPLTYALSHSGFRIVKQCIASYLSCPEEEQSKNVMNLRRIIWFPPSEDLPRDQIATSKPPREDLLLSQKWGYTPLHVAAESKYLEAVTLMVELTPDVVENQVLASTFDFEICKFNEDEKIQETSHRLWDDHKFPPSVKYSSFLATRVIPLHIAVRKNNLPFVKKLLDSAAREEQQIVFMKHSYLVHAETKKTDTGDHIVLHFPGATFHHRLFNFLNEEEALHLKHKKERERVQDWTQLSPYKPSESLPASTDSIAPMIPEKGVEYSTLYIALNVFSNLSILAKEKVERNSEERLKSIKGIITKIFDIEHFRETRLKNFLVEKNELQKNPSYFLGQLLNESHHGHAKGQATCLMYILHKRLWEAMNHPIVEKAINEYWKNPPIKTLNNDSFLTRLQRWYTVARYQFYVGFFLYIVFLTFFTLVMIYINGNQSKAFYFADSLKARTVEAPLPPGYSPSFAQMQTLEDIWPFLDTTLLDALYPPSGAINRYMVLVGKPVIRQFRVKPNEDCFIPEKYSSYNISDCYGPFRQWTEDKEPYGPGGIYNYTPTNWAQSWPSVLNLYYPYEGGYVTTYDRQSVALLGPEWIDKRTSAIMVEFAVFNSNLNLFCTCRLIIETPNSGFIRTSFTFTPGLLVYGGTPFDVFLSVIQVVLVILFMIFVGIEFYELINEGWDYFGGKWNYLENLAYAIFFICFCLHIAILSYTSKLPKDDLNNVEMSELHWIATLQNQESNFIGFLAIVFWFRLLKFLRAMPVFKESNKLLTIGKRLPLGVLMKITTQMLFDVGTWLILYIITTIGFSLALYIVLGAYSFRFRTWGVSIFSTIRLSLGDFDWNSIETSNRAFAIGFFFIYLIISIIILLNLLIAMMNQSFSELYTRATQEFRLDWALIVFSYTTHRVHYGTFLWPPRKDSLDLTKGHIAKDEDDKKEDLAVEQKETN